MKYPKLLLILLIFVSACSTSKTTQKAINSGDYNRAINLAVTKLRNNKTKKSNQQYIYMLEDAFVRAVQQDKERIAYLETDGNAANLETIYNIYKSLDNRQRMVKPLLPLYKVEEGTNAQFEFENYAKATSKAKEDWSSHLYEMIIGALETNDKVRLRIVYEDLQYLNELNPNYRDVPALLDDVYERAIDYVMVSLTNNTDKIIPRNLESDLLDFETYDLNSYWTVYHNTPIENIDYDFNLNIEFRNIDISPEQIRERQIHEEKMIVDGKKFVYDSNGNKVLDSLGKAVQVDREILVKCDVLEIRQFKSAGVTAAVKFIDNSSKQLLRTFPISSSFLFEYYYATHQGDRRALNDRYRDLIGLRPVPFPSNEQMIFDAGQDLKWRIKDVIVSNSLR
ncbi:hypothetical protein KH5_18970 [Urechidicola sp. KH5]